MLDATAGGYGLKDLLKDPIDATHPDYVAHNLDMGGTTSSYPWVHRQYPYNPKITNTEGAQGIHEGRPHWVYQPDRRVAYKSAKYPWLVAAHRYHNKVNMHAEWDLVKLDFPDYVFNTAYMAEHGQDYIVHYNGDSPTDSRYTDVVDVRLHPGKVPTDLMYGAGGSYGWLKTDHCQVTNPSSIAGPIRDATVDLVKCKNDAQRANAAINVVPATNPDVVPRFTTRDSETVNPLCNQACAVDAVNDPGDSTVFTSGMCRKKADQPDVALCVAATPVHRIAWANPAISNVTYDGGTVVDARPGDYLAFEWDDVVHDVWLVPAGTADPCGMVTNATGAAKQAHANATGAREIIAASHHATIAPFTMDTVVEGRNMFKIPAAAAGSVLLFVCSINGHCHTGQQLGVNVGLAAATPNAKLTGPDGGCELGTGYTLCLDQALQGATTTSIETNVNVPWMNYIAGARELVVKGVESRAKTPWEDWSYRAVPAKACQWRKQNTRGGGSFAGTDHSNKAAWQFSDHTLREVVEACSSSHPEACVGIAWRPGTGRTFTANGTQVAVPIQYNPHSSGSTYSSGGRRNEMGSFNEIHGWLPSGNPIGQWMQLDLGSDREVDGVVTQARGSTNAGVSQAIATYKIQYATSANPSSHATVPGLFRSTTPEEWALNSHHPTQHMLPTVVTARYIRFVIETVHGTHAALRAAVLLHTPIKNMFVGKHEFRRCLDSDRYMKLVKVGILTRAMSQALNQTTPQTTTKSVACPGCYQCREVPIAPWTVPQRKSHYSNLDFEIRITDAGTDGAVVTISLRRSISDPTWGQTWDTWDPELMCRINPNSDAGNDLTLKQRLKPDLVDDSEWTTFLTGTGNLDPTAPDTVIDAIAAGFQPQAMVASLLSKNQNNLNLVYPPGESVDPLKTTGPWHSREWRNFTLTAVPGAFELPPQQIGGARGGGFWPPKPTLKVSFMPKITAGTGGRTPARLYPNLVSPTASSTKERGTEHNMAVLKEDTRKLGWIVDEGDSESSKTHPYTGETMSYGWRCDPKMAWYQGSWREMDHLIVPPFVYGAAHQIGTYKAVANRCPDGRVNAWEATVPNGVYIVTSSGARGCSFENVLGVAQKATNPVYETRTISVEVADGKFTLSDSARRRCTISWFKLDLISLTVFPRAWLPSPAKEWWQMKFEDAEPKIGLVRIAVPHQAYQTADSYPSAAYKPAADCRKWWLYSPAKCYRSVTQSFKSGIHPHLALYPDFPGFTVPFLEWVFDMHDTNSDGVMTSEELNEVQGREALTGPYAFWSRPSGCHNCKDRPGFNYQNTAHLMTDINIEGDGNINRSEFVHGRLNQAEARPCDIFESTEYTHRHHDGLTCGSSKGGVPINWGVHNDDGKSAHTAIYYP